MSEHLSGPPDLNGHTAVVTGATGGMGQKICESLAREGADIFAADISGEQSSKVQNRVTEQDQRYQFVTCDVTDPDEVTALRDAASEFTDTIDILVMAHGVTPDISFSETTLEDWNQVIQINLTGSFLVTRAFFDEMAENGYGKIVSIGSIIGETGKFGKFTGYAASKGGLHAFVKDVAGYGAENGVYANVIAPSLVQTPMTKDDREFSSDYTPLGRTGVPEDVAEATVFFASPMSNWVTGTVLRLDGGRSLEP